MQTLRQHRRETLDEPLRAVAARAGVTKSYLSLIERGVPFSTYKRKQLAKAYKLSLADFTAMTEAQHHEATI